MLPRVLRHPLLLLTLVAFLLAGPGGVSAYVLCIGADGHAAIERDHDGGCGREESCPAPAQTNPHCDGNAEHGAPCTDIPSSLSTATPRSKPTLAAPAAVAAALFIPAATPLPDAASVADLHRDTAILPPCHTLLVLRTTVLRC